MEENLTSFSFLAGKFFSLWKLFWGLGGVGRRTITENGFLYQLFLSLFAFVFVRREKFSNFQSSIDDSVIITLDGREELAAPISRFYSIDGSVSKASVQSFVICRNAGNWRRKNLKAN